MGISDKVLYKEKKYLERVKKRINKIILEGEKLISEHQESINLEKRFMWEHLTEYTDEERTISLNNIDFTVDGINERIVDIQRYKKALLSPYFGKVIFNNLKGSKPEECYIGIKSIQDDLKFLVFDWRSPISSLFYNYEVGPASYEAPIGLIEGKILSKMQFKIHNGELIRCFFSDVNIEDDFLQEVLSNTRTDRMKNIVSTIQREQNQIIRNDKDRYLVVQGTAGSGKTSVALHRIAYLMYRDKNLSFNNVVILSPNEVFSDYISNVLPELGEKNVNAMVFSDLICKILSKIKNIESYSDFLERIYNDKNVESSVISFKTDENVQEVLDCFIKNYVEKIYFKNNIIINGKNINKKHLEFLFKEKYCKFPINERIERIASDICREINLPKNKYKNKIIRLLKDNSNIIDNCYELYNSFLQEHGFNKTINYNKKLNYEDMALLLYLEFNLNDYPNYSYIKHVVVDEAQDYTIFQIRLLKKIFKNASFTILGDKYQAINPYCNKNDLRYIQGEFENCNYIELLKSYRSTDTIIQYANHILGIAKINSVRKNNNLPIIFLSVDENNLEKDIIYSIKSINKNGFNKIAIITKNNEIACLLYDKLKNNNLNIQLITNSNDKIIKDKVIIPAYLSKGLEFESTIVYNDKNNPFSKQEENLYYVACTRAQHQLIIYNEPKLFKEK